MLDQCQYSISEDFLSIPFLENLYNKAKHLHCIVLMQDQTLPWAPDLVTQGGLLNILDTITMASLVVHCNKIISECQICDFLEQLPTVT